MIVLRLKNGVPVRLTVERWKRVVGRHLEMKDQKEKVLETLTAPDLLQEGDLGTVLAARLYQDMPLTTKFLVVVYKEVTETDGFILTAYFTNKPSEWRVTVWTR